MPRVTDNYEYNIEDVLGSGSVCTVYRGHAIDTGETVAIKVIRAGMEEGLEKEANILMPLSHPNIVHVFTYCSPSIVLEYCDGGDMDKILSNSRPFSEERTRFWMQQLAEGLVYLHKQGVTHRDLKPANLMVKHVGETELLKIADFGTAKVFAANQMMTTFVGTPKYVAPEVMRTGKGSGYGYEADLWSMGAIMYRMLVGTDLVQQSETILTAYERLMSRPKWGLPPEVRSAVSPQCNAFLESLLTVDPAKRTRWGTILQNAWLYPSGRDEIIGDFRYNHQFLLGKGSYARVYRGMEISTGAFVAVKEMDLVELMGKSPSAEKALLSLQREIDVMKRLDHPNILRLLGDFRRGDKELLVLELCSTDLRSVLRDRNPIPEPDALHWMRQIAAGMIYVHSMQIIHRDLKPANLLITEDKVLKIADFGLARVLEPCQMAATCCGSPLYMAPEILNFSKQYTDKADLWSIGVIFFEILCGVLPFTAGNHFELRRKLASRPKWTLPDSIARTVSPACATLIPALLTFNPNDRLSWDDFIQCPLWKVARPPQESESVKKEDTPSLEKKMRISSSFVRQKNSSSHGDGLDDSFEEFVIVDKNTDEGDETPPISAVRRSVSEVSSVPLSDNGDSNGSSRVVSPVPVAVKPSPIEKASEELAQWVEMTRTIMDVADTKRGADYLTEALALYSFALNVAKNGLLYASRQLTLQQISLSNASAEIQNRTNILRTCADDCARIAGDIVVGDTAFCSPPEVLLYEQALYFSKRGASFEMMVGTPKSDALPYYNKAFAIFDALDRFTTDADDHARLTSLMKITKTRMDKIQQEQRKKA